MAGDAIVIGSGAAGSVAAWELARSGWSVTVLERGRHMRAGFGRRPSAKLGTRYGSDEIKRRASSASRPAARALHGEDQAEAAAGVARSAKGALGQLGAAVGGTTLHYNAKFPRFWKQDFKSSRRTGADRGAPRRRLADHLRRPRAFYDEVENGTGVQGDYDAMPPRLAPVPAARRPYVMGPSRSPYAGRLVADAGEKTRLYGLTRRPPRSTLAATRTGRRASPAACVRAGAAGSTRAATHLCPGSTPRCGGGCAGDRTRLRGADRDDPQRPPGDGGALRRPQRPAAADLGRRR